MNDVADDQLPQTETVFEHTPLQFDSHQWQQEGYFLTDVCNPNTPSCHQGGIPIASGKMLVKEKGAYRLIDELTRESV